MVLESWKNFKQLRIKIWQLLDLFYFRNYICGTILKSSILLWLKGENMEKNRIDWEEYIEDGRFTEPSDGKIYRWRDMIEKSKELGRPLTDEEAEVFRVE